MKYFKTFAISLVAVAVVALWAPSAFGQTRVIVHRLRDNPNVRYHRPLSTYYGTYGGSYYSSGYYPSGYYGGSVYYGTSYGYRSYPTCYTPRVYRYAPTYRTYTYSRPGYYFRYSSSRGRRHCR